ncbi:hypothetical protein RB653_005131 [Dictyostelium firmibasis]|uniref:Dickkopf N-terminal cysteine-rich domain-containing protein n=1 Tax=Dictyostelium firmibasis TaxID=79012 RepID=A0AAN7YSR7_9MYCE
MKLLYLLISIIFILKSVKGDCIKCFNEGEKCTYVDSDGDTKFGGCNGGFICVPLTNSTLSENYVCRPYAKLNEECFKNSDEGSGMCELGLLCQSGKCVNARFSIIGEGCEQVSDCYSNYAQCTNKICTNPTNECRNEYDCEFSQYCNDKVCTPRVERGKNCTLDDDMCSQPLVCQKFYPKEEKIGTCQTLTQNGIGGACKDDGFCNSQDGLYCNDNICQKYVEPIQKGNCTIDPSVCDQYHSCDCQGNCYSGFTPLTIKDNLTPLYDCLLENQCYIGGNLFSSSSCASKHCGPEVCNYLKASYSVNDKSICSSFSNVVDQYCSINSSSKIVYSLFTLLLILIISLLF